MALFGLGFGLLFPSASALVADATVPAERASAFGVFYAAYSLGVVGGEVGSGLLAGRFGIASGAPFLAAAILAFAVAPLVLLAVRGQPVTTEPLPAAPSPSGAQ
jgi:MFS family permease